MKTFSKKPGDGEVAGHVVCAVCGSDDAKPRWDCGAFSFVRCKHCGHHYQDPQPSPADLLGRYDDEYRDYEIENDRNFLNLMLLGLEDVEFFRRLAAIPGPHSLLDIGCATGALLEHVSGLGMEAQGVEVCEPAARYGQEKRGVKISVGTLDEVSLPRSRYSAVHFSHVIEHVPDPRVFLKNVAGVLEPGGLGVVVTPNTSGLQAALFGPKWRSAIADHVHLFGRRNLRRLLNEAGFTVLATRTWGGLGVGTAPRWLKRPVDSLAKRLGFGDVMLMLFTTTVQADS